MFRLAVTVALAIGACACDRVDETRPETARAFPRPDRPVSKLGANTFSTEVKRDQVREAQKVMDLAGVTPGMSVADIGAGEGYYTVRLAERVGENGRVLAQDIDDEVRDRLAQRVLRERLGNVSVRLGTPDDPKLPENSFDRIFLVHMYHEVEEPYAFLWRLWPALRRDGQLIVVDVDRPTDSHGINPLLLSCEFKEVGFELVAFQDAPELSGYYAQFKLGPRRSKPEQIEPCRNSLGRQAAGPAPQAAAKEHS